MICADRRWEGILEDLRRGFIRLERKPGQRMVKIVLEAANKCTTRDNRDYRAWVGET